MTFKDSLYTVTTFLIHRLMLPDWALALSKKTRNVVLGFAELKVSYLRQSVYLTKSSLPATYVGDD
jgi:hypothetical protein